MIEMTFDQVLKAALSLRPEQKAILVKTLQVTPERPGRSDARAVDCRAGGVPRCRRVRTCDQPAQPISCLGIEVRQRQTTTGCDPRDRQRVGD